MRANKLVTAVCSMPGPPCTCVHYVLCMHIVYDQWVVAQTENESLGRLSACECDARVRVQV